MDKAMSEYLWRTGVFLDSGAGVGVGLDNSWKSKVRVQQGVAIKKLLKIFLYIEFNIFYI